MYKTEVTNRAGKTVARIVFSDRSGGHSLAPYDSFNLATHVSDNAFAVAFNRAKFADELGVMSSKVTWPGLCHSADVGIVDSDADFFPNVDLLITKRQKQAITTMGADCVTLVMLDIENQIAATGHIGWKGAAAGAFGNLLTAFIAQGGQTKTSKLWLGPAICGDCYQVSADRISAVEAELPAAVVGSGLDIRAGIYAVAKDKGIPTELVGGCTSCDLNYFSYRREGLTGRQAAGVVIL